MGDRNTEIFASSLESTQATLFVFQRVHNDVLNGVLRLAPGTSHIDFESYLVEYWLCTTILPRFIHTLAPPSSDEPAEEQGAFVFGGG